MDAEHFINAINGISSAVKARTRQELSSLVDTSCDMSPALDKHVRELESKTIAELWEMADQLRKESR